MKKELLVTIIVCTVLLFFGGYFSLRVALAGLILPRVTIGGVAVGMMTENEAIKYVDSLNKLSQVKINVVNNKQENIEQFEAIWNATVSAKQAINYGRTGNVWNQIKEQLTLIRDIKNVLPHVEYDTESFDEKIQRIKEKYNTDGKKARFEIVDNKVVFHQGENATIVNENKFRNSVYQGFLSAGPKNIELDFANVDFALGDDTVNKKRLLIEKKMNGATKLYLDEYEYPIDNETLIKLVGASEEMNLEAVEEIYQVLSQKLDREAKNAAFKFENGKVLEFAAEIYGQKVDKEALVKSLANLVLTDQTNSELIIVQTTAPEIKLADINTLGIKEAIGVGKSKFAHSIPSRVFNISLAANRVNGVVVPAGETFSFNSAIGEISKATGYQSAYIISGGKTVLGDGGGVCQVSTTVFRAALAAGLSIVERRPHAYRVAYYEQDSLPGMDASIFYPTADLKFKNDTDNNILIQASVDVKNYTMEVSIYGVKDGREITIGKSKILSQTPPPDDLFVDDPTMKLGTKKQIDFRSWGAKVSFDYLVKKNGEVLSDRTFYSNYQPWRAIYLVGTAQN